MGFFSVDTSLNEEEGKRDTRSGEEEDRLRVYRDVLGLEGLFYIPHFLTSEEERELLGKVDEAEWSNVLKRRVQHYGFRYDYASRSVSLQDRIGPLPEWTNFIVERLQSLEIRMGSDEDSFIWETPPD